MTSISFREIQSDLDRFLRRIEDGESMLVLRDQQPVAEVKPIQPPPIGPRPYGLCAGQFSTPADFDEPLPAEVLNASAATDVELILKLI
jgi:antitoxin (DNA-binding transcriptional repressor) of toxin-antitoxin stability system